MNGWPKAPVVYLGSPCKSVAETGEKNQKPHYFFSFSFLTSPPPTIKLGCPPFNIQVCQLWLLKETPNLGSTTTGRGFPCVWVSDSHPEVPVTRLLYGAVLDSVCEWICWACWHERIREVTRCCYAAVLNYLGGIHASWVLARSKVPSGPADPRRTSSIGLLRAVGVVDSRTSLERDKVSLIAKQDGVFSLR